MIYTIYGKLLSVILFILSNDLNLDRIYGIHRRVVSAIMSIVFIPSKNGSDLLPVSHWLIATISSSLSARS